MEWPLAVRGTVKAHVVEHAEHRARKPERQIHLDSLSLTLAALREALGGDEGEVVDDFGDAHPVSLAAWAGSDPETRLIVYFSYQQSNVPEGLRGSRYPPDVLARARPSEPELLLE